MKKFTSRLFLLGYVAIFLACSKDEETNPPANDPIKPGLIENTVLIQAPTKLQASEDPMAQMAVGYIAMANGLSSNFSLFDVPTGAVHSSTPIVPINGRMAGTAKYYVYTWGDGTHYNYAYQVGEVGDNYTFELFWKAIGASGWTRMMLVEENKAKTIGKFVVYDYSNNSSEELLKCDWSKIGSAFKMKLVMGDAYYDFDINSSTGAGQVKFYNDNIMYYQMIWDAEGNGTWAQFDDDGTELSNGSWSV